MEKQNIDEEFIEKGKHRGLKLFIAIILISALSFGGYYYYTNYYNNPTKKIDNILVEIEDKLTKRIDNPTIKSDKAYKMSGLIKVGINSTDKENEQLNSIFNILNNIQIGINGEIDGKNKINNINISSKYKDSKLIDGKIYTENNKLYIKLDEIYNKFIYVENLEEVVNELENNIQLSEINDLVKSLISSVSKNLDSNKIENNNENITVNGNNINANKYSITLKDKEINDFIANILTSLKQDQKFINILNKLDKNIASSLDEIINNIKESDIDKATYKISFYTAKDMLSEKLISIRQNLNVDNENIDINVDLVDDDTYLINLNSSEINLSSKLVLNDKICNIELNTDVDGIKINLTMNFNYEEISTITKEDVSNSVKIEDLTEEDKKLINKNIEKNENLQNVAKQMSEELSKFIMENNEIITSNDKDA